MNKRLSRSQRSILAAMLRGESLKSHRDIDGNKEFRLHESGRRWRVVDTNDVRRLRAAGFIDSNKKFPVATFWLTSDVQYLLGSGAAKETNQSQ